jgi:fucose permease
MGVNRISTNQVSWFAQFLAGLLVSLLVIAAASGVHSYWYVLVALFVIGESLIPVPPGPKKYP